MIKSRHIPPTCHPARKHWAKDMCQQCYRKAMGFLYLKKEQLAKKHVNRIARKFKISRERAAQLNSATNCQICNKPIHNGAGSGKVGNLCIDHDHISGRIRGTLCWSCNIGLSKFSESTESLRNASDYIEATHYCTS